MVADMAFGIDEVVGRPILVEEGAPDGKVVVDGDGIVDLQGGDRFLDIGDLLFEREFRRVHADHDQALVAVCLRPGADIGDRAQAVDAGIGPEADHDDLAAQPLRRSAAASSAISPRPPAAAARPRPAGRLAPAWAPSSRPPHRSSRQRMARDRLRRIWPRRSGPAAPARARRLLWPKSASGNRYPARARSLRRQRGPPRRGHDGSTRRRRATSSWRRTRDPRPAAPARATSQHRPHRRAAAGWCRRSRPPAPRRSGSPRGSDRRKAPRGGRSRCRAGTTAARRRRAEARPARSIGKAAHRRRPAAGSSTRQARGPARSGRRPRAARWPPGGHTRSLRRPSSRRPRRAWRRRRR